MGTSKSELRRRAAFRARVRQLLEAGYPISRIAKETSKSFVHTKRIAEQELADMAEAGIVPLTRGGLVETGQVMSDRPDV